MFQGGGWLGKLSPKYGEVMIDISNWNTKAPLAMLGAARIRGFRFEISQ